MADMQAQINSILNNPDMMDKIMTMAQSLNSVQPTGQTSSTEEKPQVNEDFTMPEIDLGVLQKISHFAKESRMDDNQKNLLHALGPYLSQERINKLQKAMQSAKMARLVSGFLGNIDISPGR